MIRQCRFIAAISEIDIDNPCGECKSKPKCRDYIAPVICAKSIQAEQRGERFSLRRTK